jgi:divinyl chlorophyllide a 8-vinyl-reductase
MDNPLRVAPLRVLVVGATGTIGRATVAALVARGHEVVCFVRPGRRLLSDTCPSAELREGDVRDAASLRHGGFRGERFDAVVSCLASRTGTPRDAWAIDHAAHVALLSVAREVGVTRFILLSAICVQKPLLAFQQAKLAFERELMASGLIWSIVRPTAFFKSLSGQVERVRRGKPFLLFGDGALTACKPIGDADLADFIAGCLLDESRWNRILPIGGPGDAITPRQQGELLFAVAGLPPRFRKVPVRMLDAVIALLSLFGRVIPAAEDKAQLGRIGRYYATESMLLWDPRTNRYDAAATPSFGRETLQEHYRKLWRGAIADDRGEHAVF